MEYGINVGIHVDGLAEEEDLPEIQRVVREGYVKYPGWVKEHNVKAVRELKCFEAVREMLLNGMPVVEVVRQVQLLNEWKTRTPESARVTLEHYKATLPKVEMMARMVPAAYVEVKKRVDKTVDYMGVLDRMVGIMEKRIEIAFEREKAMQFLMPNVEKQFAVMIELVGRIHEIKKDLGVIEMEKAPPALPPTATDWSKMYVTPTVNDQMADPQTRARLARFTETITKMYGGMPPDRQQRILDIAKTKLAEQHK